MQPRAPRRTRERVLDASLRLFNSLGEPNVSCTAVAEEIGISPGNLYYHFRSKDEIVNALFELLESDCNAVLVSRPQSEITYRNAKAFLHRLIDSVWRYRFFYRDLNELLSGNRRLETRFQALLERQSDAHRGLCEALSGQGWLLANRQEVESLVTNMAVVSTYWLSFEYIRNARRFDEPSFHAAAVTRGANQVCALLAPFLSAQARAASRSERSESAAQADEARTAASLQPAGNAASAGAGTGAGARVAGSHAHGVRDAGGTSGTTNGAGPPRGGRRSQSA